VHFFVALPKAVLIPSMLVFESEVAVQTVLSRFDSNLLESKARVASDGFFHSLMSEMTADQR
jgi:hypothetical protein